jgi:tRNA threonylcarbamoyladenosine biosynthesis protein TsaE
MTSSLTVISRSEAETDAIGTCLAHALSQGLTLALNGELGSGKTRFVRALCAGLEIDTATVNSPTFVIQQLYTDGRIPVAHMDTYRLGDIDEFLAIGVEEYLNSEDWICLIEWADRFSEILPVDHLAIHIRQLGETVRQFEFTATGPQSAKALKAFTVPGG